MTKKILIIFQELIPELETKIPGYFKSGLLFIFGNRLGNMVKNCYLDRNEVCLWQKRLENQCFRWPEEASDMCEMDHR